MASKCLARVAQTSIVFFFLKKVYRLVISSTLKFSFFNFFNLVVFFLDAVHKRN
jgi:hypothetical protein